MQSLIYLSKIRRGEIDAFNADPPAESAELDRLARATFFKTDARTAKTPIRTKDDALVALDLIWEARSQI